MVKVSTNYTSTSLFLLPNFPSNNGIACAFRAFNRRGWFALCVFVCDDRTTTNIGTAYVSWQIGAIEWHGKHVAAVCVCVCLCVERHTTLQSTHLYIVYHNQIQPSTRISNDVFSSLAFASLLPTELNRHVHTLWSIHSYGVVCRSRKWKEVLVSSRAKKKLFVFIVL